MSGERVGGAEVQYEYLTQDLDRSKFEPIVVTPAPGEMTDALTHRGITTAVIPYAAWRWKALRAPYSAWFTHRRARQALIACARYHRASLVHGDFDLGPYLVAVAEALGIASVMHVRRSVKRPWLRRYRLRRASALIAIGKRHRDELASFGVPAERITLIADATDVVRFDPLRAGRLRRDHPCRSREVFFGMVGRIEPFKHQLEFLRAAERVLATGRCAAFFVIGAPSSEAPGYARRAVAFPPAHGIEAAVEFTGPRTDIEHVIASLDVLVTLSGGSVMLEAMACGVPVISATDADPGELEIVRDGEAGLVVRRDDAGALVRAMLRLCDDAALRRALGARGRHRVESRFDRSRLARETAELYESLLT
ncbi:MAG: glycosyltransferase family 4 protein [Candidatus Binatia bacterium]